MDDRRWTDNVFSRVLAVFSVVIMVSSCLMASTLSTQAGESVPKATSALRPPIPSSFIAELQPSGTTNDLYSVEFVNVFKGFIGGAGETLLSTGNSGTNWNVDMTGGNGSFDEMGFVNEKLGYIGATASWGPKPDPGYTGDAHVLGDSNGNLARDWDAVYMTEDGGSTWSRIFIPTNFIFSGLQFFDRNFGMAVTYGEFGHTDSDTWFTSNHGKSWRLTRADSWSSWVFMDAQMITKDNWKLIGYPFVMMWNASKNEDRDTYFTPGEAQMWDGEFVDANDGWVVGYWGSYSNPDFGQLYVTNDGGWSWSYHNITDKSRLEGIERISPTEAWAVGSNGTILHTTDDGATWTKLASPTTKDLHDVHFPSPDFGWAVGDSGTIVFIHNGTPPPPPKGELASVKVTPSSSTIEVGKTARFNATALDTVGNKMGGLTFKWSISPQIGTITPVGSDAADLTVSSVGTATLTAEATYNGTTKSGSAAITVVEANKAPNAPAVTGPASGKVGVNIDFNVSGTDPNNDKVKYVIEWGDGTNGTGSLVDSGTSVKFSYSWSAVGSYDVKAMSTDALGLSSGWSQALQVVITKDQGGGDTVKPTVTDVKHTPAIPTQDDAVVVSATITDNVGVSSADVKYDDGSGAKTVAMTGSGSSCSAGIGKFTAGTKVSYQVVAKDAAGNTETSQTISFTVLVPGQKYPDVSVDKVTMSPTSPKVGDKVTISATIANNGTGDASNVQVKFSIDSTSIGTQTVARIAPQDTKSVSVSWTADKEGARVAKAEATVTGDPNTANDVGTLNFTVAKGNGGTDGAGTIRLDMLLWLLPIIVVVVVVVVLLVLFMRRKKPVQQSYYYQQDQWGGQQQW